MLQGKNKLKVNPQNLPDSNYSPNKKKAKLVPSVNVSEQKIQDRDETEARIEIGKIVCDGIDFIGMKFPKENVCKKMGEFVYKDYGYLTFSELEEAFDMVIRGDIEIPNQTYQPFSVKTLSDILRTYIQRKKPKQRIYEPDEPQDINKIRKEFLDMIYNSFEQYKATKTITYVYAAPVMYDLLDKDGLITFSADEKRVFFNEATAIFNAQGKAELNSAPLMDKLILSMETSHVRIKGIAKRLALYSYFQRLIDANEDIKNKFGK